MLDEIICQRGEIEAYLRNGTPEQRLAALRALTAIVDLVPAKDVPSSVVAKLTELLAALQHSGTAHLTSKVAAPPRLGQLVLCLCVRADRQQETLGDFEELYNTIWLHRFGPRFAALVYLVQAMRTAVAILGVSIVTATISRVWGAFSR